MFVSRHSHDTHASGESVFDGTCLTPRETEVLTFVAKGKSACEIAAILGISKRTVDEHVKHTMDKLHALNRTHAVAIAITHKIIIL